MKKLVLAKSGKNSNENDRFTCSYGKGQRGIIVSPPKAGENNTF